MTGRAFPLARKSSPSRPRPSIRPEREWSVAHGGCLVAGIDEAGRGPLAGPVVAAAVVWDLDSRRPSGLADSKLLGDKQRARLFVQIQKQALAWGIGVSHAGEIDLVNILEATRLAALRALGAASEMLAARGEGLRVGALVTDALEIPAALLSTNAIVKGDQKSASIAAASILAKVTRDRMMDVWAREFPQYGWDKNRGYPTADHYAAIEHHGPSTLHRFTFSGVGFFCETPVHSKTYMALAQRIAATGSDIAGLQDVRQGIELAGERLPPPEREALMARIGAAEKAVAEQNRV